LPTKQPCKGITHQQQWSTYTCLYIEGRTPYSCCVHMYMAGTKITRHTLHVDTRTQGDPLIRTDAGCKLNGHRESNRNMYPSARRYLPADDPRRDLVPAEHRAAPARRTDAEMRHCYKKLNALRQRVRAPTLTAAEAKVRHNSARIVCFAIDAFCGQ
jgi:hypothetical protein